MPSAARCLLSLGTAALTVAAVPIFGASAAAAGLSAPTSLAPNNAGQNADNASTWWKDPILTWGAVSGATSYTVELSPSSDWTDSTVMVALPDKGGTAAPAEVLPQTLEHANYFWRVRASNGSSNGPWSANAQLFRGWDDAPVAAPAPGTDNTVAYADVADAPWRFSWSALPDASSYEIEISNNPDFNFSGTSAQGKTYNTIDCLTQATTFTPYTSVIGKDANVDDCKVDLSSFGNPVYWRVRGIDDTEAGSNGPATLQCFGLSTSAVTPDTTTASALGTPSSAAQECSQWSASQTTSLPTLNSTGGTFGSMTKPQLSLNCPLSSGVYACTAMPELSWQPVTGALSYQVTIADDAAFTSIERVYSTPFLTLTPRDQLPDRAAGNGYVVGVQACTTPDSSGQSCGNAQVADFRKVTPAVAGLSSAPILGGALLQWNDLLNRYGNATTTPGAPAVEAEQYRVQMARQSDPDFAAPVLNELVDRACGVGSASCYRHQTLTEDPGVAQAVVHVADGTYLWRIVPVDLSGNHLPASNARTVTIDTTAPVFRLTDSDGVRVDANLHIASSESDVTGVSGSTVHVVAMTSGDRVAGTLSPTSSKTWTFNPSGLLVTGERYTLEVSSAVHDSTGNPAVVVGTPVRATLLADDGSPAWSFNGGWSRHTDSSAVGNHFVTAAAGNAASVHVAGDRVSVIGCRAPDLGKVRVSLDGNRVATVNEHQSFTECNVVLWHGTVSSTKVHTVRLSVASATGALDAVRVD